MRKANIKLAKKLYGIRELPGIDTVKEFEPTRKANNVLMDAHDAWNGLRQFRKNAERNERFTFGDQWGDRIENPDGCGYITEAEHIRKQGNVPMQNNRIRGIVRSVLGVFSSSQTEPVVSTRDRDEQSKGETMSVALQYVYQLNRLWELDRRSLEYFLICGGAFFKNSYGWRNSKMDVWVDMVNYNRIFFDNHITDPRHWDCHMIGEIHDVGLYDVMADFSDGSRERANHIKNLYSSCSRDRTISYLENLSGDTYKNLSFFIPSDETRCRVIEVWRKESKERFLVHDTLTGDFYKVERYEERDLIAENERRIEEQTSNGILPEDLRLLDYKWIMDNYWYFYYLTPQGDVLKEGETPFWHDSHPYSFKLYPFYNGQVHPFVSDFIDQQKYINRLITMQDLIMKASAKGVLLFPEDSLPDDKSMDDIAESWAAYNGIIAYKPKPGVPIPSQIVSNSTQTGAYEMLNIQLKLLEDISGVQGSLQGHTPAAGTPAALYLQQTQNSTMTLIDIYESFRELREERDMKGVKLMQQFYTDKRYINICGNISKDTVFYDPDVVKNAEFDLTITESTSSPSYRMISNDFLMQLFQAGQINVVELLQNGSFPFADKLIQSIESRTNEMQSGGGSSGQMVPPEVYQQIQQNTNPEVAKLLNTQAA